MRALSQRNDDPGPTPPAPSIAIAIGFVVGEGSGILILEELESRQASAARRF